MNEVTGYTAAAMINDYLAKTAIFNPNYLILQEGND